MVEADRDDLSRAANWQSLALAFIVWALDFGILYALALIAPEAWFDRWVALLVLGIGLAVLLLRFRRDDVRSSRSAQLALGGGAFAIVLQSAPPLFL